MCKVRRWWTYDLLVHAAVLVRVGTHGAAELLLDGVEALVKVVLVSGVVVGVGVHSGFGKMFGSEWSDVR
jgi:hypothetical protein